jgi:hypothetical protein
LQGEKKKEKRKVEIKRNEKKPSILWQFCYAGNVLRRAESNKP